MIELEFSKMSASGNDFIVIDNRTGRVNKRFQDLSEFVKKVCRVHHSVGADGVILIENSREQDFSWRFFNADGSEAEMCGNGGRCAETARRIDEINNLHTRLEHLNLGRLFLK